MRTLAIGSTARRWGATEAERIAQHPGSDFEVSPASAYIRAVEVTADTATTFRWVCQLKVAPYSYDWLDHRGRRSPRIRTPGVERLAVGQRLLIGRIVAYKDNAYIVVMSTHRSDRIFGGPIVLTYQVLTIGPGGSRLVARLAVTANGRLSRLRRTLLGWGDLVMMRKQLLTLKALAEQDSAHSAVTR